MGKRKASQDDPAAKKKKRVDKKSKTHDKKGGFKGKNKGGFKGKKKQGIKRKRTDQKDGEKPNWKELKAEKKQKKQESKEKKPYAEAVEALLSVFGANFQAMKKPARHKKVDEIMSTIGDDLRHIINRKGSARSVILLIKHGNTEHRVKIINSLKPLFQELCKDGKGHHIVLQMLVYANEDMTATICTELMRHISALTNNRYGSMVVDRVLLTPSCKRYKLLILQQLYSKIFRELPALDSKGEPLELGQILASDDGDKPFIMENMKKYLENMLSKTPSLVVVQMVLHQYMLHCSRADYSVMVDLMLPIVMQLFSCPEGCLAVLEAFNYSKAKQRKKMLQAFKEHVIQMSSDEHTVKILLRAIDVTDDTILLKKVVFAQLLSNLEDVVASERARLLFLHVLSPRSPRYFKRFLQYLPEPVSQSQDDARINCKKSNEVRQTELLKHILQPLVEHLTSNVPDLVRKNEPFLYSVLLQCFGTLHPSEELGESLLVKVAEYCIENMDVFTDATAHRRIRGLVELCPRFATTLVSRLSVDEVQEIAKDRGAIVLVRCLQRGSEDIKSKILKSLKPIASDLKATEGKSVKVLVEEASL